MRKAIIFDFFGVISSEVAQRWFKKNLPHEDLSDLQQNVMLPGDLGNKTLEELYDELGSRIQRDPPTIAREFKQLVTINAELVTYIKELKSTHKIGLCSNAFGSFIRPILESNNLIELFDTIIISSEVHLAKPDKEIYLLTSSRLGVEVGECVFIDDNQNNVKAATALGMEGILFTSNEALKARLLQ